MYIYFILLYVIIHIIYIHTYAIMKTMCPPGYYHSDFVDTHALGHMMYGYTLLVPMNQKVLCLMDHLWSLIYTYI